jgi:hypothetical protein
MVADPISVNLLLAFPLQNSTGVNLPIHTGCIILTDSTGIIFIG